MTEAKMKQAYIRVAKRMAYEKLVENSKNKKELLLKDDAHVDMVLKNFNIHIKF